jgi:tRNA pseudouridine55 synthase
MTSHDVVDAVRRIFGQRSVGHTGTLDPSAEGLLVLCLGGATRFSRYLGGCDKTYRSVIRFGRSTDTDDREGQTTASFDGDLSQVVTADTLLAATKKFRGEYDQLPPAYSAKKVDGVPAYELARKGVRPGLKAVRVRVGQLNLERFELPDATLEITCSAGFYVRSLARDLGEALGTGAYLQSLRRTRIGNIGLDGVFGLDELREMGSARAKEKALLDLGAALAFMPAVSLDSAGMEEIFFGRPVEITGGNKISEGKPSGAGITTVRIIDGDGGFLGVGELDPLRGSADVLLPRRLLTDAFPEALRRR